MSTINLNELRDRAYKIARDHGFHDADWSNEHVPAGHARRMHTAESGNYK